MKEEKEAEICFKHLCYLWDYTASSLEQKRAIIEVKKMINSNSDIRSKK